MPAFEDLVSSISGRYNKKILKYCDSLFSHLNIGSFWYYRITDDGHFTYLDTDCELAEYVASEKLYLSHPHFRNPQFFKSGVVLLESGNANFIEQIVLKGKGYNMHHPLEIITKFTGGMEAFGFDSNSPNFSQTALLLSELSLLRFFIRKFRDDNHVLFNKLQDCQINLINLLGFSFHQKYEPTPEILHLSSKYEFLKDIGFDVRLSFQEIKVLKLFLEGYSAGKIAPQIHISKRTVEHHIERIKGKLGCNSKAELMQKARELEEIGCF
jgi:DNA-binding CsgD family transcriptional regulator